MKITSFLLCCLILIACQSEEAPAPDRPTNVILIMTDDQGWGDTGYNGNTLLKTSHLDSMAAEGIQFNRFYAAAPVCSPTRASCLTGRHPYRLGIYHANTGHLPKDENNLAKALKANGYKTGHFGKWHLGTLTNDEMDANRGGRQPEHYAPPWERGFDVCFSTESKVPTWDPMITPNVSAMDIGKQESGTPFGTSFWTGAGEKVSENLEGDASRIVMDRVLPFIEEASQSETPFFAVVWFHAPHLPVLTGAKYQQLYKGQSEDIQQYYGAITAMDEQLGRLRQQLRDMGQYENTMLFFTSDNGPEGKSQTARTQGSTKGLKGRKRSLYEGGVRVPGIWVWPERIRKHQEVDFPVCTSDYYPTILELLDIKIENQLPLDGVSIANILDQKMDKRRKPIGFQSGKQLAWMEDEFKLYSSDGQTFELYNILYDPNEEDDLVTIKPNRTKHMKEALLEWVAKTKEDMKEPIR